MHLQLGRCVNISKVEIWQIDMVDEQYAENNMERMCTNPSGRRQHIQSVCVCLLAGIADPLPSFIMGVGEGKGLLT